MPENMTCWPPFSRQRNKASGQLCVCNVAYLRGRYNGGAFTKTVIDATMCAITQFIRDLLDFAGLRQSRPYNERVYRLHRARLDWFAYQIASLLKAGVEDEINNQRKAFDMLAWSEGTDNGRQKTRNHGYDVIVGGELFTDYSDHPRKLVTLNPKLKSTGAGRYQLLPVGGMPTASSLAWKTSLRKSGRCGIAAD